MRDVDSSRESATGDDGLTDLVEVARIQAEREAERGGVGTDCLEIFAQGGMPSGKQLAVLKKIRTQLARTGSSPQDEADVDAVVKAYLDGRAKWLGLELPETSQDRSSARGILPDLRLLAAARKTSPAEIVSWKMETYCKNSRAPEGRPLRPLLMFSPPNDLPPMPRDGPSSRELRAVEDPIGPRAKRTYAPTPAPPGFAEAIGKVGNRQK